jgi:integrase
MECIRLRVKDFDFEMNQIVVRNGKGTKDRIKVLAESAKRDLKTHSRNFRSAMLLGRQNALRQINFG